MAKANSEKTQTKLRDTLHEIIFEADTPAGKAFDVFLLVAILVSVIATCLETVDTYGQKYHKIFAAIEWVITVLFTAEYAMRLYCVQRPLAYAFSFYGIVDLLSILPTFLGIASGKRGVARLAVVRSLRLLRVFRIFKLGWFVSEADALSQAVWQSRAKVVIFLFTVIILVTLTGTLIYLIEADSNEKLSSIPAGIYWAIVTMTTVGYGDVVPTTPSGQFVSAILILLGYSLIIVPTGFVSAELVSASGNIEAAPQIRGGRLTTIACSHCMAEGHGSDAVFCRLCGEKI